MQPRGIRNNNPGNVKRTTIQWAGMAKDQSKDSVFIIFKTPEFGIRCIVRILKTYQKIFLKDNIPFTLHNIIARYAPNNENDTKSYMNFVAERLGISIDATIDIKDKTTLLILLKAIIQRENGQQPYSDECLLKGMELAEDRK